MSQQSNAERKLRESMNALYLAATESVAQYHNTLTDMVIQELKDELNIIETYAKKLGWDEQMNTTAAIWLADRARVDGPIFNLGRSEGQIDVKVMVRKLVDPEDVEHLSIDGVLKKVADLVRAAKNEHY